MITGSCAAGSSAPVMVTLSPSCMFANELFLPSRLRKRVPKSRVSKRVALVCTVQVKSDEPHAVLTVRVLPLIDTTRALRRSISPLLAIWISSGHRLLPVAAAAAAGMEAEANAGRPSAAALCAGREKKNAASEKAKKTALANNSTAMRLARVASSTMVVPQRRAAALPARRKPGAWDTKDGIHEGVAEGVYKLMPPLYWVYPEALMRDGLAFGSFSARSMGFEPTIFSVTGRRVNQATLRPHMNNAIVAQKRLQ